MPDTLMENQNGRIFDIQRFSVHDGPGIRTVVFMKGCPLRCRWCHNPESQTAAPVLFFEEGLCAGCEKCIKACPHGVHEVAAGKHTIKRELCDGCGRCVEACLPGALVFKGRTVSAREVVAEALRDRAYYARSGGGVTLSGGEPLAQPEFAKVVLAGIKKHNVNTAVETCGFASRESYESILGLVDLFMYDVKLYDAARHREFCGTDNAVILENLGRLVRAGKPVLVRIPLIPGITDTEDNLKKTGTFLAGLGISRVELIPYHAFPKDKCKAIGIDYPLSHLITQTAEELEKIKQALAGCGVSPGFSI